MTFSRTDFPVPEGPRMAEVSPRGTSKVMSSRTVWLPNCLETPLDRDDGVGRRAPAALSGPWHVPVSYRHLLFSSFRHQAPESRMVP